MKTTSLSTMFRRRAVLRMLLSLPLFAAAAAVVLAAGMFPVRGYIKPYEIRSLSALEEAVNSPLGPHSFTVSLDAAPEDLVDAEIQYLINNVPQSQYLAVFLDGKYVMCMIPVEQYDAWMGEAIRFTGTLVKLDPEVQAMVMEDMAKQNIAEARAREMLYPYVIETGKGGELLRSLEYLLPLGLCALGLLMLAQGAVCAVSIHSHPELRRLKASRPDDGFLEEIEMQFMGEAADSALALGKGSAVHLLPGWIVIGRPLALKIIKAGDMLWACREEPATRYLFNAIAVRGSHRAKFHCRGRIVTAPGEPERIDRLMEAVAARYPHAAVGHSDALEMAWNADAGQFGAAARAFRETAAAEGNDPPDGSASV